ncbi:MAG: hypothetical protein GEU79_16460 [Acidimicrobiia bacterium]|nr:hypothetical protein [Acidimicrobiia bacterium]
MQTHRSTKWVTFATIVVVATLAAITLSAQETISYEQGFEQDTEGWSGDIIRVPSGSEGIDSSIGDFHATVENSGDGGPNTEFGGIATPGPRRVM